MELNKNNIIDDLEKIIQQKDSESMEVKLLMGNLKKQMLEKQREFENEKQGLKDVRFFNYFKDCVSVGIKL